MQFILCEEYGDSNRGDICINVSDERINGTYASATQFCIKLAPDYDSQIGRVYATLDLVDWSQYSVLTLTSMDFPEDMSQPVLECEYNKDIKSVINDALATKQDKQSWELISSGELTEEVSTISVTTDKEGNAFELDELYAEIKIPNPNNIAPYFYVLHKDGAVVNIPFGDVGSNDSLFVASWKREMGFKVEQYQYYNVFKTARFGIAKSNDTATGFKIQLFKKDDVQQFFPAGTEIKVWGL